MPIDIREKTWPLVTIEMTGSVTEEESTAYLRTLDRFLAQRSSFALVVDLTGGAGTASLAVRRAQAEFLKKRVGEMQQYVRGLAIVVTGPAVRAIVTSILWTQPITCPYAIFSARPPAMRWVTGQLQLAGISVSA
jgi:hypothetical protein